MEIEIPADEYEEQQKQSLKNMTNPLLEMSESQTLGVKSSSFVQTEKDKDLKVGGYNEGNNEEEMQHSKSEAHYPN